MTGKQNLHLPTNSEKTRCCKKCHQVKTLTRDHFYFKADRGDFDKTCAACRKSSRSSRYIGKTKVEVEHFPVSLESSRQILENSKQLSNKENTENDLFDFFEILKGWRDELKQDQPEKFNNKWEESNV